MQAFAIIHWTKRCVYWFYYVKYGKNANGMDTAGCMFTINIV